jgi:hypothetical protein
MCLKKELATTAELVSTVLKQLKWETVQHAKAVQEKRDDFASLKHKFPSLLNIKEDEELFYDKERVEAILAQVDREIVRIKECDHHREDGIEVHHLCTSIFLYIGRDRHL